MEAILFKGKFEIITLPNFKPKSEKLYEFITKFLNNKNIKVISLDTFPKKNIKDYLTKDTNLLIGHSQGSDEILKFCNREQYPNIKGIFLLDPKQESKDFWNDYRGNKILLTTKMGNTQNYKGFKENICLLDDHYFNNSFNEIEKQLNLFLKNIKS